MDVKRILILPGGGMLGYPQAVALLRLRQLAGRPIYQTANLIAATSIGGINGLMVGSDDIDTTPFFDSDGPVIFNKGWWPNWGMNGPVYGAAPIEKCLKARFGNKTVADLKTNMLVTGMDANSKKPFFLRSWDTRNFFENNGTPLWKIARFTSAAEHYFPGYQYGNRILWDGGNIANNPAEEADDAADILWGKDAPRRFLVLGCGHDNMGNHDYLTPGLLGLAKIMVGMLFDAAAEDVGENMTSLYGSDYIECQPTFAQPVAIDDASPRALAYLKESASNFVKDSDANFRRWLS